MSNSCSTNLLPPTRSPGLDALAYVSSVELPKLSLNSAPSVVGSKSPFRLALPNGLREAASGAQVKEDVGVSSQEGLSGKTIEDEDADGRVRAYAKLEFPEHDFFIRKLSVIIGRRPPPLPTSPAPHNSAQQLCPDRSNLNPPIEPTHQLIDVDLGPIRAVSRWHSKVCFDWSLGSWVLEVLGRNGCVIDGRWKARGEVAPLRSRTKIQIAERIFYFILPQLDEPVLATSQALKRAQIPSPIQSDARPHGLQRELADHSAIQSMPQGSLRDPSELPALGYAQLSGVQDVSSNETSEDEELECESIVGPDPTSLEVEHNGSRSEEDVDNSLEEPRLPSAPLPTGSGSCCQAAHIHSSPRRRDSHGSSSTGIAYLSSEGSQDLVLPRKAPASKAPLKTPASQPTDNGGLGKGKGKGHSQGQTGGKGKGKTPFHSADSPQSHLPGPSTEVVSSTSPSKRKLTSVDHEKDSMNRPQTSSETRIPIIVKERPKILPVKPAGAEIGTTSAKPPYTYASLIAQALAAQADEDGKMLVSEMCEWMAGVYPFYGTKEKASDWQSAVRHNLNADKRFKKIERMPTDGGKGNFWTLRREEWANFDGLELKRVKNEPKPNFQASKMVGGPGRSIGNVARPNVAAHHRTILRSGVPTPNPNCSKSPPPFLHSSWNAVGATPARSTSITQIAEDLRMASTTPEPTNSPFTSDASVRPLTPTSLTSKVQSLKPQIHPALLSSSIGQPSTPPPEPGPSALPLNHGMVSSKPPFRIVIEELPDSVRKKKVDESRLRTIKSSQELTKLIEEDPPMYSESESNKLLLNPRIFKSLKPGQVQSLERLGGSAAVKILQKFIVEYFKGKISKKSNHYRASERQDSSKTTASVEAVIPIGVTRNGGGDQCQSRSMSHNIGDPKFAKPCQPGGCAQEAGGAMRASDQNRYAEQRSEQEGTSSDGPSTQQLTPKSITQTGCLPSNLLQDTTTVTAITTSTPDDDDPHPKRVKLD